MAKEIDAAHVLSSYSAVLVKETNEVVRDIEELPYPKHVIKLVLIHCMKLTKPSPERDVLRSAYLSLADFQALSNEERASVKLWGNIGSAAPANMTQEQLLGVAKQLSGGGREGREVQKRGTEEAKTLIEELKTAGF